jgi:hypothetical protein
MWRNPKYSDASVETEIVAGPAEDGVNLATIPRGPGEELRVTLSTYNDHPYIGVRVWIAGPDGAWFPARGKGVSVRIREIVAVGQALAKALRMTRGTSRDALADDRPVRRDDVPYAPARPRRDPGPQLPLRHPDAAPASTVPFSEFD